mmetsp:Transcript_112978/g.319561  ORF Transcript_112978/g.319561 Transcript_112978/m.319561 type:complete len:213 (+) Transcript_112978:310-948(+)
MAPLRSTSTSLNMPSALNFLNEPWKNFIASSKVTVLLSSKSIFLNKASTFSLALGESEALAVPHLGHFAIPTTMFDRLDLRGFVALDVAWEELLPLVATSLWLAIDVVSCSCCVEVGPAGGGSGGDAASPADFSSSGTSARRSVSIGVQSGVSSAWFFFLRARSSSRTAVLSGGASSSVLGIGASPPGTTSLGALRGLTTSVRATSRSSVDL